MTVAYAGEQRAAVPAAGGAGGGEGDQGLVGEGPEGVLAAEMPALVFGFGAELLACAAFGQHGEGLALGELVARAVAGRSSEAVVEGDGDLGTGPYSAQPLADGVIVGVAVSQEDGHRCVVGVAGGGAAVAVGVADGPAFDLAGVGVGGEGRLAEVAVDDRRLDGFGGGFSSMPKPPIGVRLPILDPLETTTGQQTFP